MSTYIVDDETINKIVSYLYAKASRPDWSINWECTKLAKMGYVLTDFSSCAELAQNMYNMNVAAVQARYGKGNIAAELTRRPDFTYVFTPATQIEAIKAIKAWMYQCTEGIVPSLALYEAMNDMLSLLCIDFVEQTEEYEAAPWG